MRPYVLSEGATWMAGGEETFPAFSDDPADRTVLIPLKEALQPGTIITLLIASSVTDFAGNAPCVTELKTGFPADPCREILFNEYCLIRWRDARNILSFTTTPRRSLTFRACHCQQLQRPHRVSSVPRQLLPDEYVALTTDRQSVAGLLSLCRCSLFLRSTALPAMSDDYGIIAYDRLNIIDRVDYGGSMHLLFLSGTEGVALEKVAPSLPSDVPATGTRLPSHADGAHPALPIQNC